MLSHLAPARRRLVLAVAGVLVLGAVVGAMALLLSRDPAVQPVPQATPGPVLLVPGYGGSTTALEALAEELRAQGRDAVVVSLPGHGYGDLGGQAEALGKAAVLEQQRTGARSVDVVGFSAGGVVARAWVRDHGGAGLARRIVTLGSPHHGTDLAGLAGDLAGDSCPVACQQLEPDSDFLRHLNAGDETPVGPLWVSIWTTDDKTVVPPTSADLAGALDFSIQSVCPGLRVAHGALPPTHAVIDAVLRESGVDRPTLPSPEIC
jgi:triacylglycerol esterase/lipase EstA (alpha/beta hydrolase family)